jgi:hypothetical protein
MKVYPLFCLILSTLTIACPIAYAEQPIFDEMPRWSGGWGVQVLEEYRREGALLKGDKVVDDELTEEVHLLHIQGVYTWHKSIRITAKLPIVLNAYREQVTQVGQREIQEDQGLGDLTLALPLKRYFNLDGRTGSWTLAPQIRVPLNSIDEYKIYDQAWGGGVALGYETEMYRAHGQVSVSGWLNSGQVSYGGALNLSLGLNYNIEGFSGHIKWKNSLQYLSNNTLVYVAGPTLYARITDTLHTQIQWMHDFYDHRGVLDHGEGDAFRVGVGLVF